MSATRTGSAGTTETRESEGEEGSAQAPGLEVGPGPGGGTPGRRKRAGRRGRAGRGLTRMMRTLYMRISRSSLSSEL